MTAPALLRYRSLIWNFAQRDLKSRFKGTVVGWGWSLLLPLATLLIYTLVTHYIFKATPEPFGNGHAGNYAVFLFVGLTGWGIFSNAVNTAIPALLGSGPLLKKIYFPAYAPVLGAVIAVLIQSGIEVALVLGVLIVFSNVGVTWLMLPLWFALFIVFTSSVAVVFSIANIYFRDFAHVVAVFLQLLFYATPILYRDSLVTNHNLHRLLMSNPLGQFIDIFRSLVYGLQVGRLFSWAYTVGWTAFAALLALWVFHRYGRDLAEEV